MTTDGYFYEDGATMIPHRERSIPRFIMRYAEDMKMRGKHDCEDFKNASIGDKVIRLMLKVAN